jgi:hypothetical protein
MQPAHAMFPATLLSPAAPLARASMPGRNKRVWGSAGRWKARNSPRPQLACVKPISRAMAPTRFSCSGHSAACLSTTARLRMPRSSTPCSKAARRQPSGLPRRARQVPQGQTEHAARCQAHKHSQALQARVAGACPACSSFRMRPSSRSRRTSTTSPVTHCSRRPRGG